MSLHSRSEDSTNQLTNSNHQIHSHLELRHLCNIAEDERGWEMVRSWLLSHCSSECRSAASLIGENGTVAIHMACKSCAPLDIIEMLLNACEGSLEFKDDFGWFPLHYACHYGATEEVLEVLILSCPKLLKEEDSKGRNPLHFAIGGKKNEPFTTSMFSMLTQNGAARVPDAKGMLPIHYACAYGTSTEVIELLLNAYPDSIYSRDDIGYMPLTYAMGNCERDESPGAMHILLSKHPDQIHMDFEQKIHPLYVLANRTKYLNNFKDDISKQCFNNALRCLLIYLRNKPLETTNFFTSLQSLPQCLEDQAVVEPAVQELLNQKISTRFPTAVMMLDFYAMIAALVTYMIAALDSIDRRYDGEISNSVSLAKLLPLYLSGLYFAMRELVQILSFVHLGFFRSSWLKRATNWMEVCLIIQILFWTIVMDTGAFNISFFQTGIAVTLFFLWVNFLNYLRGLIVEFAVFISGVVHVLQRLGAFLMALLIILVAFMQIFYTLFLASDYCVGFQKDRSHVDTCDPEGGEPYRFCTNWDTFLSVYTMLLGEVDEGDFETSTLATILFIFFVFLVVILLANVLIAIVTDSYGVIRNERAAVVFWSNRLDFVVEMDVISNGPVTRKVKSIFVATNSSKPGTSKDSLASNLYKQIMELFDRDINRVEVCSIAFLCLNFLRLLAIFVVMPLWFILGLCSAGLFWPPQIRQKLMRQKIKRHRSAAMVKLEHQKNEIKGLKHIVSHIRKEISASHQVEINEMKAEISSLHSDVIAEMRLIKESLATLFELQD